MKIIFLGGWILLSACGNPLAGGSHSVADDNFSPGIPTTSPGGAGGQGPVTPPPPALGVNTGFEIAPGHQQAVGHSLAIKASVTPNDLVLSGPRLSGKLSIGKTSLR